MSRRTLALAVLLLGIPSTLGCLRTSRRESPSGQSIAAQVDAYLKPYLDAQDFSGAVLIARGERILVDRAYGMANFELAVPNTPKTRFRIASVSKQFTAAAVLLLEQRKLLSTSDPLLKFIPDFPRGDEITIHHLLTHTSGITGNMETLPDIQQDMQAFHSLRELAQMLKKSTPKSPAGSTTPYSNKNYVLLAHIVEKVSGVPFEQFLRQSVFESLGMKDSGSAKYMEVFPHMATGYEPGFSGLDGADR